jgi:hypothetical protein
MPDQGPQLPWESGWLDQASTWIHTELEPRGVRVTGPIELLRMRAWSKPGFFSSLTPFTAA